VLTLEQAIDVETWRALVPELTLDGDGEGALPRASFPDLAALVGQLREEGHVNVPAVLEAEAVARLRGAVVSLAERGLPPVYLWMYDEVWRAFRAFRPFLAAALGADYVAVPELWTWHVPAEDAAEGWRPHRDQIEKVFVDADGSPQSLTLWMPLTDATPLNGCIYLLPSHLDPEFRRAVGPRDVVRRPQDIRAQPAVAGSVLAWNHGVLHWGGRASRRAAGPRISVACEFQRPSIQALARPLLPADRAPPFTLRLWLMARAILGYRHMATVPKDVAALAQALQSRFYAEVANG
jgi:hypothetical protein